jgi:hypothetical protein
MKCVCKTVAFLKGVEADRYMNEHLRLLRIDYNDWKGYFECPETGLQWVETHPFPALQAGGPPELRRVDSPKDQTDRT